MKKYLKLRKHTFKNIDRRSLTKVSSFPINSSIFRKHMCRGSAWAMLMPSPRDLQRKQMPRGCPGGGWAPLELIDALQKVTMRRTQQCSAFVCYRKNPVKCNACVVARKIENDCFSRKVPFSSDPVVRISRNLAKKIDQRPRE